MKYVVLKYVVLCALLFVALPVWAGPDEDLKAAAAAIKTGKPREAARLLRSMNPAALTPAQRSLWQMHCRTAGVRAPDRVLLRRATGTNEARREAAYDQIVVAGDYLKTAEYARARAALARAGNPDILPPKLRIRHLSVAARLERIDPTGKEKTLLAKLVHAAGSLPSAASFSVPAASALPPFAWDTWWAGKRWVALLPAAEAARVRDKAREELTAKPGNTSARLRLGYASLALGDESGMRETLAQAPLPELSPSRDSHEAVTRGDLTTYP